MKKILKFVAFSAILLMLAGGLFSCNNKEELFLTVDETPMIIETAEARTYSIAVISNGEWTAVVENADWCTLNNSTGSGDAVITVNVAENTLYIARSATIKITSGNLTKSVVINQNAATGSDDCEWTELSPVVLAEQLKNSLDIIFSENNELVKNIGGDTILYIINSKEELSEISNNANEIDIDFENQSIIWGRLLTSSISNSIASKQLFLCHSSSNFKYEISVQQCTDCWTALGYLYYWEVYPQKININNVALIVN